MSDQLIVAINSIVVAVITGGLSFLGVIYSSRQQHSETLSAMDKKIALIQKDIVDLEKKQDIHNGVIERMYVAEKSIELLEERQKTANHRIDDLEADVHITVE